MIPLTPCDFNRCRSTTHHSHLRISAQTNEISKSKCKCDAIPKTCIKRRQIERFHLHRLSSSTTFFELKLCSLHMPITPAYGSIPATQEQVRINVNNHSDCSKVLFWSTIALSLLAYGGNHKFRDQTTASYVRDYNVNNPAMMILGSPMKGYLLDDTLDKTLLWHDQYVDHIGINTEQAGASLKTYRQQFMKKSIHWKGPGHPILVIVGGEGPLDPPMLYQFVHDGLAEEFGAFVLSPEHRFYGESRPILP